MNYKRKLKIINKNLQSAIMFKAPLVIILFIILITAGYGVNVYIGNKEISKKITEIKQAIDSEKDIVNAFLIYGESVKGSELTLHSDKIRGEHDKSIKSLSDLVVYLEELIWRNILGFIIFTCAAVISLVVLIINLFSISHRIAGPVQLVTDGLKKINNYEHVKARSLRKKDLCVELHTEYVNLLKKHFHNKM
ncbi:MAG: hypothetical protein JXK07_05285 [Spirochaetes bacterium]|nr:hypothetical protein [Spirochaetota bacterium]MBN2769342.1 hypothetical protein [Spirochaetota bacterium]